MSGQLESLCENAKDLNILRQVRYSLPAVAAGIERYARFCDLLKKPYFPPTEDTVLKWSAVFKPGKAFSLYVSRLLKACQLLCCDTSWNTQAVRGAAAGLKNDQVVNFKPRTFISSLQLRTLLGADWYLREIQAIAFLSFLFLLRMGSEALPVIRADWGHELTKRTPQVEKSVLGVVREDDEWLLRLKLNRRKNLREGAILKRTCSCDPCKQQPDFLCPLHTFWKHAKSNVERGARLFPSLTKGSLNRSLRVWLKEKGFADYATCSTHALRRGGADEVLKSDGDLATLLKAGGWSSAAFRAYISTEAKEDEAMNSAMRPPRGRGSTTTSGETALGFFGEGFCDSGPGTTHFCQIA